MTFFCVRAHEKMWSDIQLPRREEKVHYWRFGLSFTIKRKAQKYFNEVVFWVNAVGDSSLMSRARNERIFVNWQTFSKKKVKELLRSIFELSFILKRASFDCTSSCGVLLAYLIVLLHFSSSSFCLFVQLIHSFIYDNKRERKRIHTYISETHFEGVLFTHQAALQQQKRENSLQSSHLIDFFLVPFKMPFIIALARRHHRLSPIKAKERKNVNHYCCFFTLSGSSRGSKLLRDLKLV